MATFSHVGAVAFAFVRLVTSDDPQKGLQSAEPHHDDFVRLLHTFPKKKFAIVAVDDPRVVMRKELCNHTLLFRQTANHPVWLKFYCIYMQNRQAIFLAQLSAERRFS